MSLTSSPPSVTSMTPQVSKWPNQQIGVKPKVTITKTPNGYFKRPSGRRIFATDDSSPKSETKNKPSPSFKTKPKPTVKTPTSKNSRRPNDKPATAVKERENNYFFNEDLSTVKKITKKDVDTTVSLTRSTRKKLPTAPVSSTKKKGLVVYVDQTNSSDDSSTKKVKSMVSFN